MVLEEKIQILVDDVLVNMTWDQLAERMLESSGFIENVNVAWLVMLFIQITLLQIGMLMLEIGSVRAKNAKAMIIKSIGNSTISALCYYMFGYGFSFGRHGDNVIGWGDFATKGDTFNVGLREDRNYNGYSYANFLYYFAMMGITPTIVSGSLSERTNIVAYFVCTFFLSTIITPSLIHWAWSQDGWASQHTTTLLTTGVLDFAGSSVIHVCGGSMALVGAWVVEPRQGRFMGEEKNLRMPRRNVTFSVLGVVFIWGGYHSLNLGSLKDIKGGKGDLVGLIPINTTLCAVTGALMVAIMTLWKERGLEPYSIVNGITTGLVASSAGCATMSTWASIITGLVAGSFYFLISSTLCSARIDDVVDVVPMHLGGGLVGMVMAGLFSTMDNYKIAISDKGDQTPCGAFYKCNGLGYKQFVANMAFVVVVIAWSTITALVIFLPLKVMGLLRVDSLTEQAGLDFMNFGGDNFKVNTKKPGLVTTSARTNKLPDRI